jgi:hypothetical protein
MTKSGPVLAEEQLSNSFRELLALWDAVDKILCFIMKRKMACTVSKVSSVYSSLHGGKGVQVEELAQFCSLCPLICVLRHANMDAWAIQSYDVEFVFHKSCESLGKFHITKRRKLLLEKLSTLVLEQYAKFLESKGESYEYEVATKKGGVLKEGWKYEFDVNVCALPDVAEDLRAVCEQYREWRRTLDVSQAAGSGLGSPTELSSTSNDNATESGTAETTVPAESITEIGGAQGVLEALQREAFYKDQIVHVERLPGRSAVFADLAPPALPEVLQQRLLEATGVTKLYRHQARAIDALRQGRHAVVSTSTASGKSIIYNIPVLEAVLQEPSTTALYLFPTKVMTLCRDLTRLISKLSRVPSWLLGVGLFVSGDWIPCCSS